MLFMIIEQFKENDIKYSSQFESCSKTKPTLNIKPVSV